LSKQGNRLLSQSAIPLGAAAALATCALLVAGCGGADGDEGGTSAAATSTAASAPPASDFPKPDGRDVQQLATDVGLTNDYVAAPAGATFTPDTTRFAFGMFAVDGSQMTTADVAVYAGQNGEPAKGPYPARIESLATEAPFRAKGTTEDPDAAKVVYVADVPFKDTGNVDMIAVMRNGGKQVATTFSGPITVAEHPEIPDIGDAAPVVDTPTVSSVGGDIASIDTRVPPDSMHDVNLSEVIGKKPVVLVFATPALCASRVCGPVVDVEEQVKAAAEANGDDVAFIHMEIYEDNTPPNPRSQVSAYGLVTEPWVFVIDSDGKVAERIEGAFSVAELQSAVDKVT
jgi:peroxiredoxin